MYRAGQTARSRGGSRLPGSSRLRDRTLHALAVDHVLLSGGTACWIDPGTRTRTDPLVDLAPSDRIPDRVRVARAFTPFQHLALLSTLPGTVTDRTELVVVPALDGYYRNDDRLAALERQLDGHEAATLRRFV